MSSKTQDKLKFPALVLVGWRGDKLPRCTRHAKMLTEAGMLASCFTPVFVNLKDEECPVCQTEEQNRKAARSEAYND